MTSEQNDCGLKLEPHRVLMLSDVPPSNALKHPTVPAAISHGHSRRARKPFLSFATQEPKLVLSR